MTVIDSFTGEYSYLSNFFVLPEPILGGYIATENAYQAAKTLNFKARQQFKTVQPGHSKHLGRALSLRPDWEQVKEGVMFVCLREKFQNPELAAKLIATGDSTLVEGNYWHDNVWGNCICGKRQYCLAPGKNLLGKLLMEIREGLINARTTEVSGMGHESFEHVDH